jgi:hypothetical protein
MVGVDSITKMPAMGNDGYDTMIVIVDLQTKRVWWKVLHK